MPKTTAHGFEWGPLTVTRLAEIKGRGFVLEVKSEHHMLEIAASPKGQVVRVWKDGVEIGGPDA